MTVAGGRDSVPFSRVPRISTETAWLLRASLILALILGIPTFAILAGLGTTATWHATTQLEIQGDTWDGNLATDGRRVYLLTREEISGFWGVLYARSSGDGGRTWGPPVRVSAAGAPSAARHALTVAPDGELWAAWSQRGEAPLSQQLILRRSADGGQTWAAPVRVSQTDIGLVGIPALVMTDDLRFVAFTDGERGTVIVQVLGDDGSPSGDPVSVRATTRQLYDDSGLLDAGVSAAAVGHRAVLVMHDGTDVWRLTSATGRGWAEGAWYTGASFAPPRVVAIDERLTALAAVVTGDGVVQISVDTSSDGGRTWGGGATWHDPSAGVASLAVAPDQALALWESCGGPFCAPSIRVGDIEASNGRSGRIAGESGWPEGAVLTDDTLVVAWIREGASFMPEDRTVVVATGPRP